jgi:hypothetical protein
LAKVCRPVLEEKVPLFVIPLLNVGVIAALSVQLAPLFIVTKPIKVFAGFVTEENESVPLVPPPTVVVPETVNAKAPVVKVVPSPTIRLPPIVNAAPVVAVAVPLKVKLLLTDVTGNVFAPLPLSIRLLYATTLTVCAPAPS